MERFKRRGAFSGNENSGSREFSEIQMEGSGTVVHSEGLSLRFCEIFITCQVIVHKFLLMFLNR